LRDAAVGDGFAELMRRAAARAPAARIEGVLVAPHLDGGVETILGVQRDPAFGPVVLFGLGGIFVEALADVALRRAPIDRSEALAMIGEIRGRAILEGARGRPRADIEALADALVRLSAFAAAHAEEIDSVDLNPVLVLPQGQGAFILDALIVPRSQPSC
jgi:acyl-CoA synthetase (NDP forming)